MIPAWISQTVIGDRRAIARAISAVENESPAMGPVLAAIAPHLGRAHIIGITGAPGVGKSTLVSALISRLRSTDRTVGVVAIDPSSPRSGGAILGDRVRMSDHGGDREVFVRSVSTRGAVGGLSRTAARVVDVLDAAGKDVVIVETVGAGQSEIDIGTLAHTKVVINAPGLGDEVQAIKHGILDIADVLVVNKADLPGADKTAAQLRDAVRMSARPRVPVLRCSATTGDGIDAVVAAIDEHGHEARHRDRTTSARDQVANAIASAISSRLASAEDEALETLLGDVMAGRIDVATAAERILGRATPDETEDPAQ